MKKDFSSIIKKILPLNFFTVVVVLFIFSGCEKTTSTTPVKNDTTKAASSSTAADVKSEKLDLSKYNMRYDDIAKILGGFEVSATSSLFKISESKAWKNHQKFFTTRWADLQKDILDSVEYWAKTELSDFDPEAKTVFYPFGGPDFLFAYEFFPNANTYILQGLEPVNRLPEKIDPSDPSLNNYLDDLQNSLRVLTTRGYFITKQMNSDLNKGLFRGVIPVILLFMARTDNTVLDVKYITTDKKGDFLLEESQLLDADQVKNGVKGCVIYFTDKDQKEVKKLYYFSSDTQNKSWANRTNLQKLVTDNKPLIFFTKAASYLLHGQDFADLRSFILENAKYLVQTDTGIPVKFLENGSWNMTYYGTYIKPVSDFPWAYQANMKTIYSDASRVKHMPFGICYRWKKSESNIMKGIKK